jgi:hypothetical protein
MKDIFTKEWFIATVAAWVVIVLIDEVVYYWWKSLNPGSMYSGILAKHPITNNPNTLES